MKCVFGRSQFFGSASGADQPAILFSEVKRQLGVTKRLTSLRKFIALVFVQAYHFFLYLHIASVLSYLRVQNVSLPSYQLIQIRFFLIFNSSNSHVCLSCWPVSVQA